MITRSVAGIALLCVAGCGFPAAKVEEAKGHVQRALAAWKGGEKPESLKGQSTPVEFHEAMWNAGEKLVDFEMGKAYYVDAQRVVRCEVRLTVRKPKGKGKDRTEATVYEVTLGPPVKVLNNPMP